MSRFGLLAGGGAGVAMGAVLASALLVVPAVADTSPPDNLPATVSGDVLPAPQINGVAWDQEVAGGKVFAGGKFTTARPFGAAKGQSESARQNLLSYDLHDGKLTGFSPSLNGEVKALTASPDGSLMYVGGQFTEIDGHKRYRLAAFDVATGKLVESFVPRVDFRVNAIAVTGNTVYAGGAFGSVGGKERQGLAAFDATTGALKDWVAHATGGQVNGVVASPDGSKVVAVGQFSAVNGQRARGWAAVSTATGEVLPWEGNSWLETSGRQSGIYSVSSDQNNVYIAAFSHGQSAYESVAAARWADGSMEWLLDCHGDSYDTASTGEVMYFVSHVHNCEVVGHKPETRPWSYMRANAVTSSRSPLGTVNRSRDFNGAPAAEFLHWYPDVEAGTFTGQNQGAWTVETSQGYVLLGGEFPAVNGIKQQGLARFGPRDKAPNSFGPLMPEGEVQVQYRQARNGGMTASVKALWDVDNEVLTYTLYYRDQVVDQKRVASNFFTLPMVTLTHDREGADSADYRVIVSDPLGNATDQTPDGGAIPVPDDDAVDPGGDGEDPGGDGVPDPGPGDDGDGEPEPGGPDDGDGVPDPGPGDDGEVPGMPADGFFDAIFGNFLGFFDRFGQIFQGLFSQPFGFFR